MAWVFTKARRITKRRHSAEAQAILDRLAAYLHDSESEPVEMLCGFWKDQQDAITYQEMRALILEGYVDEVTARLWQQDYADLVKNRMPQIWNGAMIAGSQSQPLLTSLPNFTFNLQTPGVIRWIQSRGAEMVTVSTQRQKDAIALLLEDKMRNSHTVDELARLIRPCVGLYRQQAAAVSNFYDHMVKTLTEQHPRTKPERIQLKALDKATKYAERLHRQRAVTIAQTEMAFAYNYGADEGIRQAQADFLIGRCEKIWSTSGDDRVCPDCAALDGQRIGMEDTFFSGNRVVYDENGLYPPRHPRCACAVQYVEIEPPPFNVIRQQSAGDSAGVSSETQLLKAVDFSDKSAVMREIEQAEQEFSGLSYENNCTITSDGKVWRTSGESNAVNLDGIVDAGSSLRGSYSYHNHPDDVTHYSFSADDVAIFVADGQEYSKASDSFYEYVMRRTQKTVDKSWDDAYDYINHRFDEILRTDVFRLKWQELIDPDMDEYHETMKVLSEELNFLYERTKKG